MDISLSIDDIKLNFRVAILLETKKGFVFEKGDNEFFFPVGGRIKINETSVDAAKREIKEELGIEIDNFKYMATLENFFSHNNIPYHEISIIYYASIENVNLQENYYTFNSEEITKINIKPRIIQDMILKNNTNLNHFIIRHK